MQQAEQGLRELQECVDTVITIPNDDCSILSTAVLRWVNLPRADDVLRRRARHQ